MSRHPLTLALVLGVVMGLVSTASLARQDDVPAEFLEIDDCPTEPGCAALILQDDVTWDNDYSDTRMWNHRTVKIFTQEGLDAASVKIYKWVGEWEVRDLEGRTIRPDGTEVRLDANSALEETELKGKGFRKKVISFQMPAVEIGSIIEYRYKFVVNGQLGYYTWWVQDEFPILNATMRIRSPHFAIRNVPVGLKGVPMKSRVEDGQWGVLELRHVPSIREEPLMPPEDEARGRVVFRPSTRSWTLRDLRTGYDKALDLYFKRSGKAKKLAKEMLGEASTPQEQLALLYRHVQQDFDNSSFRQSTEGEVNEGRNLYVDDVVRAGQGSSRDLTRLFVFLARQAGFQAEVALVATRDDVFFREEVRSASDFDAELAAVVVEVGR